MLVLARVPDEFGPDGVRLGRLVRAGHVHQPRLAPVVAPPRGRMEAVPAHDARLAVDPGQVGGHVIGAELAPEARADGAEAPAGTQEAQRLLQVEVVRAEVVPGVEADDGVEEAVRVGERAGLGVQGVDAPLQARLADALQVPDGLDPEVRGPHLRAEFAGEEDGADGLAAAEVEHALARRQRHPLRQRLRQPEDVRPHAVGRHPRLVPGGAAGEDGVHGASRRRPAPGSRARARPARSRPS